MSHQKRNGCLVQQIEGYRQIEKADTPLPVSMTWLVGPLLDCTVAIMACGSSSAIVPRTERIPIDGCQLPPIFQWR